MLFNSIEFLIFLPIVFVGYWLSAKQVRLQNLLVVVASYIFYGWWDWRFLILIAFTSGWAYLFGLLPRSKWNVAISLVINLGILGVFKYYNFFVDSIITIVPSLKASVWTLNIVLPVGISFYTFQALSYTIDIYRGAIKPTKDPIAFFAFISFFPQLVAGPIERATNLLPQFLKSRHFDYLIAVEGCRQMLWGFFKKVLVADSCAYAVNAIYDNPDASSISFWCAAILFAFQIYGDFSGYSDIAIGCSKLFGIRLMRNFAYPYFARDIAEFWRRWHISLTTWFKDYLYIPLGGSRCGTAKKIRNTFAIFIVSGLWHGANWTFVLWGVFHAICFLPLLLLGKNRKYIESGGGATTSDVIRMSITFLVVTIGWVVFRAPNVTTACNVLTSMITFSSLELAGSGVGNYGMPFAFVMVLMLIEWFNRRQEIPRLPNNVILRWTVYLVFFGAIVYWRPEGQQFIYFQF